MTKGIGREGLKKPTIHHITVLINDKTQTKAVHIEDWQTGPMGTVIYFCMTCLHAKDGFNFKWIYKFFVISMVLLLGLQSLKIYFLTLEEKFYCTTGLKHFKFKT